MRTLILALLTVLFTAGCSDLREAGEALARTEKNSLDLAELRGQLAAAQAQVAAQAAEIEKLKWAAKPKAPHLVVKATGEDLGPWIAPGVAWSDALAQGGAGGQYDVTYGKSLYYSAGNCTGDVYAVQRPYEVLGVVGTDGTIWIVETGGFQRQFYSMRGEDGACVAQTGTQQLALATPTGIPATPHRPEALTIALR